MKIRAKSTKFVVLVSILVLGVGEAFVVGAIISAVYGGLLSLSVSSLTLALAGALILYLFTPSNSTTHKGFRLVENCDAPRRAWLILQFLYGLVAWMNYLALLIIVLPAYLFVGSSVSGWVFSVGIAIVIATVYRYLALVLVGQMYETRFGASFLGASAFAKLAELQFADFDKGNRYGLANLLGSLDMCIDVFKRRRHFPADLDQVFATVEGLSEMEADPGQVPQLQSLAHSLSRVPNREELPSTFTSFLGSIGWSTGFKFERSRRRERNQWVTFLGALVAIAGSLLSSIFSGGQYGAGQFGFAVLPQYYPIIFAFLGLIAGVIASTMSIGYSVPIRQVLRMRNLS